LSAIPTLYNVYREFLAKSESTNRSTLRKQYFVPTKPTCWLDLVCSEPHLTDLERLASGLGYHQQVTGSRRRCSVAAWRAGGNTSIAARLPLLVGPERPGDKSGMPWLWSEAPLDLATRHLSGLLPDDCRYPIHEGRTEVLVQPCSPDCLRNGFSCLANDGDPSKMLKGAK